MVDDGQNMFGRTRARMGQGIHGAGWRWDYTTVGVFGECFSFPFGVVLGDFYFEVVDGGGSELPPWGHVLGAFAFCGFPFFSLSPLKTLHCIQGPLSPVATSLIYPYSQTGYSSTCGLLPLIQISSSFYRVAWVCVRWLLVA
jgi:hypothetical protein